jgi:hypothetical protein
MKTYGIEIIKMQSDNSTYGDPDNGAPQEALNDFLNLPNEPLEEGVTKGEHTFIIWRDDSKQDIFYANAWGFKGDDGEQVYTTYYKFKARELVC